MARVVIGAILFNHAAEFREAVESILAQTFEDFALLLVDDQSTDDTPAIAREYAALDPRVTYIANDARLGMVGNSVHAFEQARQRYPEAEYFAWASDHDLWHPRWLQQLVDALDAHPDVVLAYPQNRRIGTRGEILARKPWSFDTFGIADRWRRVTTSIRGMSAGNMVYGLYRADVLARAGVYRRILVPDRLLMTELAIYGQFKQVPQVLWFRRWYGRIFSLGRQRANFFPGRRPLYMYAPWWISHGVSLFWTFGVQGIGLPRHGDARARTATPAVTRAQGIVLAIRYLLFSGLFHCWQSMRALRQYILERAEVLRPVDRQVRLMSREIRRRGPVDWTWAHLKPYVGGKTQRKAFRAVKNRLKVAAFQAIRVPGLALLRGLRAIPLVRRRVIPSLLKQELDQVPAAPVVAAMNRELARLRKTTAPIIVGPWLSEVGYELLYWIPFLNWAITANGFAGRRLIVISRGGAKPWYAHLGAEYVDVFDLYSVDEYKRRNEERWKEGGHQKQMEVTSMDRDLIDRVKAKLKIDEADLLHPSMMYRLLRFYWFGKAGVGLLDKHTSYRRFATIAQPRAIADLPDDYVAVRFYFRPSFPDTPQNRAFAAEVIRSINADLPVVLLNTGLSLDDHDDLHVAGGHGIHRVDHQMTPERNLEVQTEIISRARAFVGTYGGLAYVGPYYGVPSIGFYSEETELVPVHLDMGWRLGKAMDVALSTVDTRSAGLLRMVLGEPGANPLAAVKLANSR
jgi:glycosyltransferase involved in cell wall biosynthesis